MRKITVWKKCGLISVSYLCALNFAYSQNFVIKEEGTFEPQMKKVVLFTNASNHKVILFKTNLQVNTDGTPISYHPDDLQGNKLAINSICNAIVVKRVGSDVNLCLNRSTYNEALKAFQNYRDSNFEKIPSGYSITWKNVLIPETVNGKEKPCIISTGRYRGYFSSATSLKNGLSQNKGECDYNNQVNPLEIPALVLVGGKNNIVRRYGARLGDLIVAYNPGNKRLVYGLINDIGPKHNLGEGSVLLNMKLQNKNDLPKNKNEANQLVTKNTIVLVIPGSNKYKIVKPYTEANVNNRVMQWLQEAGFQSSEDIINFLEEKQSIL